MEKHKELVENALAVVCVNNNILSKYIKYRLAFLIDNIRNSYRNFQNEKINNFKLSVDALIMDLKEKRRKVIGSSFQLSIDTIIAALFTTLSALGVVITVGFAITVGGVTISATVPFAVITAAIALILWAFDYMLGDNPDTKGNINHGVSVISAIQDVKSIGTTVKKISTSAGNAANLIGFVFDVQEVFSTFDDLGKTERLLRKVKQEYYNMMVHLELYQKENEAFDSAITKMREDIDELSFESWGARRFLNKNSSLFGYSIIGGFQSDMSMTEKIQILNHPNFTNFKMISAIHCHPQ